jgi:hypothetical protein
MHAKTNIITIIILKSIIFYCIYMQSDASKADRPLTQCQVKVWHVDWDPQFLGFGLLVATFSMLLTDNKRGVQNTLLPSLHFTP